MMPEARPEKHPDNKKMTETRTQPSSFSRCRITVNWIKRLNTRCTILLNVTKIKADKNVNSARIGNIQLGREIIRRDFGIYDRGDPFHRLDADPTQPKSTRATARCPTCFRLLAILNSFLTCFYKVESAGPRGLNQAMSFPRKTRFVGLVSNNRSSPVNNDISGWRVINIHKISHIIYTGGDFSGY